MVRHPSWHQDRANLHRQVEGCAGGTRRCQGCTATTQRPTTRLYQQEPSSQPNKGNKRHRDSCRDICARSDRVPGLDRRPAVVPRTTIGSRKWMSASERTKDTTNVRTSNIPLWTEDQTCTTVRPMKADPHCC